MAGLSLAADESPSTSCLNNVRAIFSDILPNLGR